MPHYGRTYLGLLSVDLRLEKRLAPRRNTLIAAVLVFNGGRSRIDCVIRNLSESGAKLELKGSVASIPNTFDLIAPGHRPIPAVWCGGRSRNWVCSSNPSSGQGPSPALVREGTTVLVDADVDRAFEEPRLAIAEVIDPLALEFLVVAELGDLGPAFEEAVMP